MSNFYGTDISIPLSSHHNKPNWDNTTLGKLHAKTKKAVYLEEIPTAQLKAGLGWRVVDAWFTDEDTMMSYFRAYDLQGNHLPYATFGVDWDGCNHRISGGFSYPPPTNNIYVTPSNSFPTFEVGGYTVRVLDRAFPSEALAFGLYKQGKQHQNLIISFKLFHIDANKYPNDF